MRKSLPILCWLVWLLLALPTAQAQTPVISGTLSVSLTGDANNNSLANPSDQLSYSLVISNTGSGSATGVNLTMPAPTNTTLVTGSLKTSALARPDAYTTLISGTLSGTSVLPNDFGLPTKTVLSFGPSAIPASTLANGTNPATTDQGGTVVMNTDGTFSYTPSGSFVGYDRFGYTATTTTPPNDAATVTIGVGTPVTAIANSYTITGNLTNTQSSTATALLGNDTGDQRVVTAVNGNTANVGVGVSTAQSGTVVVQSNGTFVYEPRAGYEGPDSFTYTANNGLNLPSSATVSLTITGMIWFIDNSAAAGGTGTLARPFNTLGGFASLNNGGNGGLNPAAGDNIFLYSGSGNYTGGLPLLATQKLIGQGATASLPTLAGITPAPGSAALPATGGTKPVIVNASGNGITLGSGNLLRGLSVGTSSATALAGSNFGSLTISEVSINTSGQGLGLSTGSVSGSLEGLVSSAGARNVSLSAVTGVLSVSAGVLSGASGTSFSISGGSVSVTYNGSISQASNAALLSVSGGHTSGTLLFQNGTLSATNGPGLQFDNADGTYTFSGTTTLNGGDASIDIIGGSGGTFTFPASTGITNPSGSVINIVSSAPTFTYSGTFTKTSSDTGINAQNNTGGSITINGTGTKTLSTLTANAINLTNNTGVPINFSGNNLAITTTGGTGFLATGGGTVTITGTGNTISSGTGTALNVANTTIGASGLTFQSISSNGGSATGIILDNTGTTGGGFTITGTGTTPGTGGTIANKTGSDGQVTTGCGMYLNNTEKISLSNMNFTGPIQNFGIRGFAVNNFTLLESNFTGAFGTNLNPNKESVMHFGTQGADGTGNGLTGTAVFNGNLIGGGFVDNIGIFNNNTGSLNISFADGTHDAIFEHNATSGNTGNDLLNIETRGNNGTIGAGFNLTFSVTGVEFRGSRGDNIQTVAASNSTHNITILNNTFHNTHPQIVSGGGGIAVTGAGNNYVVNYNVESNSFRGAKSSPIHIAFGGQEGDARGTVLNNIIGVDDPDRPPASTAQLTTGASDNGNGINMYNDKALGAGVVTHATRIQGNQIRDVTGIPIYIRSNGPGPLATSLTRVEATILNNIVEEVHGSAGGGTFSSLYIVASGGGFPDQGKIGVNIRNNTFHQDNTSGMDGDHNAITFDQGDLNGYPYLPGYTGAMTDATAISNFLVNAPNSNTMTNGYMPNGTSFVYANAEVHNEPFVLLPVPLYAAHSPASVIKINSITQAEVDKLLATALKRYENSGVTKSDMDKLRKVTVTISDLPVLFLGASDHQTITIDADAAGFGWFVDETPDDDIEFNNSDISGLNKAAGKMDLLTVLMHELGHQIGFADDVPNGKYTDLMEGNIMPGQRHLP